MNLTVRTNVRTVNVCRILCLLSCADFGQLAGLGLTFFSCGAKIAVTVKLLMDAMDLDQMTLLATVLLIQKLICFRNDF